MLLITFTIKIDSRLLLSSIILMCCNALFQLHAAICQNESQSRLGLSAGSSLLSTLKHHVVTLASNVGVVHTVQYAAQSTLQNGWSILMPTPEERANALSALLPNAGEFDIISCPFCMNMNVRLSVCGEFGLNVFVVLFLQLNWSFFCLCMIIKYLRNVLVYDCDFSK